MSHGRKYKWAIAMMAASALLLSACGDDSADDSASGSSGSDSSGTCVDGDSVKLGFLNSTSGAMAISEQTVRDSLMLAAKEINAGGGIIFPQTGIVWTLNPDEDPN